MNDLKKLLKEIKKYKNIVIARHLRLDPDALASELALKEILKENFNDKNVYAVGISSSKFRYMGILDRLEEKMFKNSLLIVLDTPDLKRVDVDEFDKFKNSMKIDHHPFQEKFCELEYIDDTASSTCEIIIDFAITNNLKINDKAASLLFQGVVSDSNKFTTINTTEKTFELIYKLISKTNLNFQELYDDLYNRPLSEIRLQGYIAQNMIVTENGLGYIKITDEILKEFEVDSASPGNMINNFNNINEVLVWVFISEDIKNNIIRITMRSRGPVINAIANEHNGGGHERASGARVETFEEVDILLKKLDNACALYRSDNNEN